MAIFQPINVYPTTKSIDVLRDNTFSVEINTNDKVIAYQLTILDWDNNVVLAEDRVDLEDPLYNGDVLYFNPILTSLINGNDYKWRLRLFQDTTTMVITSGFVVAANNTTLTITKNTNIKVGMFIEINKVQREIINVIVDEDNYQIVISSAFPTDVTEELFNIISSFIDTNPDYVLYARTTPTISITNFANEITERNYKFQGSYFQQEYVPMIYYEWHLYIVENNVRRMIFDTGKVYRADFIFDYDGYITGNQYQIEFTVATESGVTVTTGMKSFSVHYDTVEFLTEPQLYLDCRRHAIRINWTTPISFNPTVLNLANSLTGNVKGIAGNTIQLATGLDIQIGAIVYFNQEYYNEVAIYNPDTGLLALRYSLENEITDGTPFVILNYVGSDASLEILRSTPYRMSNSASIGENTLTFKNYTGGYIGKTPNNANITFQFRLPDSFWSGNMTKNMRLLPIMHLETDDSYNVDGFEVFVNLNKLVYIKPATSNNQAYKLNVTSIVNDRQFIVSGAIDFATQKYIKFVGYSDIIEIVAYDEATKMVTIFDKVPFDIITGSEFIVQNTLSYNFYTLLSYFPLQEQGTFNATYDYIWDDTKTWDDTLYWFEGGGAKQRIANTWYKTRINDKTIDVRAGGV